MKVLVLTHRVPYVPDRGDRIRAYYLLRALSVFADVSLFSFAHDAEELAAAGRVPFVRRSVALRASRPLNALRGAAKFARGASLTHILLDAPGARATLARLVEDDEPDVVLAYCSGMARFALEPPLAGRPLVVDLVDVDSAKWAALAERTSGPRSLVYRREARHIEQFERRICADATAVLVVNERERETLRRIARDAPIHVVSNGIELDAFRPRTPPAGDAAVTFCGALEYAPNAEGIRWFIESVWPIVRATRPDAQLVVVGGGAGPHLRRLARTDSAVTLTGKVESVAPYLWRSAAAIAPLHVARGLQNKALEALAAGVPVVVTPAVLEGLPLEARAACAVASDPDAFARRVIDFLALTPDDRRRRAALADLASLSWRDQLQPLEAIMREAAYTRKMPGA